MLPATKEEIEHVAEYMLSQAPELRVQFVQKVYSESVLSVRHDVWDVHTDVDRWWVITEPMNLYAQDQFPNMDLALTFHIGLCLRIPRGDRQKLSELPVEPFAGCFRGLQEASDALSQASEVADYSRSVCGAVKRFSHSSQPHRLSCSGPHQTSRPRRRISKPGRITFAPLLYHSERNHQGKGNVLLFPSADT